MRYNKYHEPVYNDDDLADILMSTKGIFTEPLIMETNHSWPSDLDLKPLNHRLNDETESVAEYDRRNHQQWYMPTEYKNIDIAELVLLRCKNDAELQRAGHELLMFADRDLLDMLKYMHYLVDIMNKNSIVYGVGRGSSTASFVLYLLGVHKINSLYYDLDITEFLK